MKLENRIFQIWLSLRCPVMNREVLELLHIYGTPYDLYATDEQDIEGMPCSEQLKKNLRAKDLQEATAILRNCEKQKINILFWQDEDYPLSLRAISKAPLLLYYIGDLPDLNRRLCIAMVGSRTAGDYAKAATYRLSYELAAAGVVMISGMALGVDAVSAAGALAAGGTTVAVLACGVDIAYPASHTTLRNEIIKHGVVMSEYPPGTRAERYHFPARNRLISGLSQGTVVVQAAQSSGALITADHALTQGRDLFALPGQMDDKYSQGTNALLHDGAVFVQDVYDILDKYQMLFSDVLDMKALHRAKAKSQLNEAFCRKLHIRCKSDAQETDSHAQPHKALETDTPAIPTPQRKHTPQVQPQTQPQVPSATPTNPPSPVNHGGDRSAEILASLSPRQRQMFEVMPLDKAVSVGDIMKEGFTISEVLANMTVLASKGLVSILPGSLYIRA